MLHALAFNFSIPSLGEAIILLLLICGIDYILWTFKCSWTIARIVCILVTGKDEER